MSDDQIDLEAVQRLASLALKVVNDNLNGANGHTVLTALLSITYSAILFIDVKQDREIFRSALEKMYALLPTQEVH
jgi:hypothetical protein